jgi:two-component system response regulator FixJ
VTADEQGELVAREAASQTVFIVDDDPAIRESLGGLLRDMGYAVCSCESAEVFLEACSSSSTGCAILDIGLPGMDGLALQRVLVQRAIGLPVIFLTGTADVPRAVQALKDGALDFLEKPVTSEQLIARVCAALALDASQREAARSQARLAARVDGLTAREKEVMTWIVAGKSSKEIGRELRISFRTVEGHRRRIMEKTRVRSLAELADLARMGESV